MEEDTDLERLAEAELLLEAKRGLARSNVYGPAGWKRCPLPGANKKFLQNTIMNAVSSNKLKERSLRVKHDRDHIAHKRECKVNQRSESLEGQRTLKEKEKPDQSERMRHVKLKPKETNNVSKHLKVHSQPDRDKSRDK